MPFTIGLWYLPRTDQIRGFLVNICMYGGLLEIRIYGGLIKIYVYGGLLKICMYGGLLKMCVHDGSRDYSRFVCTVDYYSASGCKVDTNLSRCPSTYAPVQ